MTKEQFIAAVETKPNFIKWAVLPALQSTEGDVQKWRGVAFIRTPDGRNTINVWFMYDSATDEATWQNSDTLEPEKNTNSDRFVKLQNYIKNNFLGGYVVPQSVNLDAYFCEAVVFPDVTPTVRKNIFIYKPEGSPLTHREIT